MRELSTSEKVLLFVGSLASVGGVCWLLYDRHKPVGILEARGQFCASMSVLGLFVFCTAISYADKARKANWSPQRCQWLPACLFFQLIALFGAKSSIWAAVPVLIATGIVTGLLCRRLAYPDLRAEEAYRAKQELHIFSK